MRGGARVVGGCGVEPACVGVESARPGRNDMARGLDGGVAVLDGRSGSRSQPVAAPNSKWSISTFD